MPRPLDDLPPVWVSYIRSEDPAALTARVPGVFLPKPDTPLWLSMRRDRCYVFRVGEDAPSRAT